MKRFWQSLVVLCAFLVASSAWALDYVVGDYNALGFLSAEYLLDANGNFYTNPDHDVQKGDIFCGVMVGTYLVTPSDSTGAGTPSMPVIPGGELTGYFASQVVDVIPSASDPNYGIIVMAPAPFDPNGILDVANGEVMRVFEDDTPDYNIDTISQGVTTATDGDVLWSLGMVPSSDGDSPYGYWYSTALIGVPAPGDNAVGESYAGLNFMNLDGAAFAAIDDPHENIMDIPVEIWFNSEISTTTHDITDSDHFHFSDRDPAVFHPVPVPGAVWLLGSALLGLLGFRKKVVC